MRYPFTIAWLWLVLTVSVGPNVHAWPQYSIAGLARDRTLTLAPGYRRTRLFKALPSESAQLSATGAEVGGSSFATDLNVGTELLRAVQHMEFSLRTTNNLILSLLATTATTTRRPLLSNASMDGFEVAQATAAAAAGAARLSNLAAACNLQLDSALALHALQRKGPLGVETNAEAVMQEASRAVAAATAAATRAIELSSIMLSPTGQIRDIYETRQHLSAKSGGMVDTGDSVVDTRNGRGSNDASERSSSFVASVASNTALKEDSWLNTAATVPAVVAQWTLMTFLEALRHTARLIALAANSTSLTPGVNASTGASMGAAAGVQVQPQSSPSSIDESNNGSDYVGLSNQARDVVGNKDILQSRVTSQRTHLARNLSPPVLATTRKELTTAAESGIYPEMERQDGGGGSYKATSFPSPSTEGGDAGKTGGDHDFDGGAHRMEPLESSRVRVSGPTPIITPIGSGGSGASTSAVVTTQNLQSGSMPPPDAFAARKRGIDWERIRWGSDLYAEMQRSIAKKRLSGSGASSIGDDWMRTRAPEATATTSTFQVLSPGDAAIDPNRETGANSLMADELSAVSAVSKYAPLQQQQQKYLPVSASTITPRSQPAAINLVARQQQQQQQQPPPPPRPERERYIDSPLSPSVTSWANRPATSGVGIGTTAPVHAGAGVLNIIRSTGDLGKQTIKKEDERVSPVDPPSLGMFGRLWKTLLPQRTNTASKARKTSSLLPLSTQLQV